MSHDEQPDPDEHGECRLEIEQLQGKLAVLGKVEATRVAEAQRYRAAVKALDGRLGCNNPEDVVQACEDYVACEDLLDDSFDGEDYSLPRAVEVLMGIKADHEALLAEPLKVTLPHVNAARSFLNDKGATSEESAGQVVDAELEDATSRDVFLWVKEQQEPISLSPEGLRRVYLAGLDNGRERALVQVTDAAQHEPEVCPLCGPGCVLGASCEFCHSWHCSCEEGSRGDSVSGSEGAAQGPSSVGDAGAGRSGGDPAALPKLSVTVGPSRMGLDLLVVTYTWAGIDLEAGRMIFPYGLGKEYADRLLCPADHRLASLLDQARAWPWLELPVDATDADVVELLGKLASVLQCANRTSKRRGEERDAAQRELCRVLGRSRFAQQLPHDHAVIRYGLDRADVLFPGAAPPLPKVPTPLERVEPEPVEHATADDRCDAMCQCDHRCHQHAGRERCTLCECVAFRGRLSIRVDEPTGALADMYEEGEPDDRGDLDER